MLVVAAVLLVLVIASGVERNGAQRWLSLPGGFTLQPSELAKVALCVFAAAALSRLAGSRRATGARPCARWAPPRPSCAAWS